MSLQRAFSELQRGVSFEGCEEVATVEVDKSKPGVEGCVRLHEEAAGEEGNTSLLK